MNELPYWVGVHEDPATYQASCSRCGWHTVPMLQRKRVERFAKLHAVDCPRPVRRNGALFECGCWWYATLGSEAGKTRRTCPLHGDVLMVKANVEGPHPDPGEEWIPAPSSPDPTEGG